jgi:hypothetical protein
MKSTFTIFFLLFLQCSFLPAQTVTIQTVEVCAGQEVFLPVTAASLVNVGALTLYIGFDTNNLSFVSIENVDPQLSGMSTNLMTAPSQLAFAWSNTTAINFTNGKLFDIKFISTGQSALVYYNPGCEIADPSGTAIPATYGNGAINSGVPLILSQPANSIITEGGHTVFTVISSNTGSYFWRESQDFGTSWITLEDEGIYSGTHTSQLSVGPVPLSYNNYQFQCVLAGTICQTYSVPATLQVDELTGSSDLSSDRENKSIYISPVPFTDHTTVNFNMPADGDARLQVVNSVGQIISEIELPFQQKGYHHILLDTRDWNPGVYFIRLTLNIAHGKSFKTVKTIKNT